jgi:hypothetical protein
MEDVRSVLGEILWGAEGAGNGSSALCAGVFGRQAEAGSAGLAREVGYTYRYTYISIAQAANITEDLGACISTIQMACDPTMEADSMALVNKCSELYDELDALMKSCHALPSPSCTCWDEVATLRGSFQAKCMSSSQEGEEQ